jgi:hypothetical protein
VDLQLYFRVLWRFRFLVAVGLLVALTLSTLSLVSVSASGVTYRQQEVWGSSAKLLVTQEGFPEGRSITELYKFVIDERTGERVAQPVFPGSSRFEELAALYAALATTDSARAVIMRDGPLPGTLSAATVSSTDGESLPLVAMTGTATSPEAAMATANQAATGFVEYIEQRQARDNVPADQRSVLTVVEKASAATLLVPRKLTRPIFIFLAVMMAVLGLAFVLENMRPRVRPVAAAEADAPMLRRSA